MTELPSLQSVRLFFFFFFFFSSVSFRKFSVFFFTSINFFSSFLHHLLYIRKTVSHRLKSVWYSPSAFLLHVLRSLSKAFLCSPPWFCSSSSCSLISLSLILSFILFLRFSFPLFFYLDEEIRLDAFSSLVFIRRCRIKRTSDRVVGYTSCFLAPVERMIPNPPCPSFHALYHLLRTPLFLPPSPSPSPQSHSSSLLFLPLPYINSQCLHPYSTHLPASPTSRP